MALYVRKSPPISLLTQTGATKNCLKKWRLLGLRKMLEPHCKTRVVMKGLGLYIRVASLMGLRLKFHLDLQVKIFMAQ